jgi:hypothetical protein
MNTGRMAILITVPRNPIIWAFDTISIMYMVAITVSVSIWRVWVTALRIFQTLGYLSWTVVYNVYISPLSKFPGPKLAACTNLQNLYWTSTGQYHYKLKELHDKYGDAVRTAPKSLVYRNSQAWKGIHGHRKVGTRSFLKDPKFYLQGPRGPNLLNASDKNHSRERRLLSHAFSQNALREQESLVQ